MSIFAKVCYETALKFKGKGVTTKIDKKKHQVYFKVYCDDTDIQDALNLARISSNIVMLEYQGDLSLLHQYDTGGVYLGVVHDFGMDITEADIAALLTELPANVILIVRVPLEFSNMQFIQDICTKYSNVRFCGGTIFCLEGCKVGCCGRDILEGKKIKVGNDTMMYQGCSCALQTYQEDDLELEEGKVQKSQGKKSGGAKKRTLMFRDLLYSGGTVDF